MCDYNDNDCFLSLFFSNIIFNFFIQLPDNQWEYFTLIGYVSKMLGEISLNFYNWIRNSSNAFLDFWNSHLWHFVFIHLLKKTSIGCIYDLFHSSLLGVKTLAILLGIHQLLLKIFNFGNFSNFQHDWAILSNYHHFSDFVIFLLTSNKNFTI